MIAIPADSFHRWLLAFLVLGFCNADGIADSTDYPPIKIRAYGTLSGSFHAYPIEDRPASVLTITCDNEEKAKLVVAKYLSDLQLLPGVKPATIQGREGAIPCYEIGEQGAVLAARDGSTVYILAASTSEDLARIESGNFALTRGHLVFTVEVTVPMFLDRFDKYAFHFYYTPWTQPQGLKSYTYDPLQDFDWAQKLNHCGLTIDAGISKVTTAEGQTDRLNWEFAAQAALERGMPLGIQPDFEGEAPDWLLNRYRDETAQTMPGYVGGYFNTISNGTGSWGLLSWASTKGEDALLSAMQQNVRRMAAFPNVTNFMEPHGETGAACPDVLLEYGPVADASYRAYLQKKYPAINVLNAAWGATFSSWNQVRVPELVTFAGYGPDAIDLGGTWRIEYEPTTDGQVHTLNEIRNLAQERRLTQKPAPEAWFGEKFDDGAWPTLTVPGDALQILLPRVPAVFRRSFEVPAGWTGRSPKTWLYIWDLNIEADRDIVRADLNGTTVGKSVTAHDPPHWCVFEVTAAVRDGTNVLAIRTPRGLIAYKVYLTHDEPKAYPDLGPLKNAQWSDFISWTQDMRVDAMRRGMEMVREVDPNRGIVMMAPTTYTAGLKDLARAYGGDFHDTGGMGGWWHDNLPALMRGAGLPMSTEPGNGPANPADFKLWYGNWVTEGVNAIDFFRTIGEVAWNPEIRKYFEDNLKVIQFIGKYHVPFASVAALYSSRVEELMGYPWRVKGSAEGGWIVSRDFIGNNYVSIFEPRGLFRDRYESDAVTETSFSNGDAARYRVIFDSNTTMMDARTVAGIEDYVRNGGVFVTYGETARHDFVHREAWPLERLTGYHVIEPRILNNAGRMAHWGPDEPVLSGTLPSGKAVGMIMKRVAPDAVDLVRWADGSVAVGMRPLGKGYIIEWGCLADRHWIGNCFDQIMAWRGLSSITGHIEPGSAKTMFRHFVSNNGLYDVWAVWNMDKTAPLNAEMVLDEISNPSWAIAVKDGARIPVVNRRFPVRLEPLQLMFYLTPCQNLAQSSAEWFTLQRSWWRGTTTPLSPPLPEPSQKSSVDLSDDWSLQEMNSSDKGEALAAVSFDDSKWAKVNLGLWDFHGRPAVMLRKRITIPKDWVHGDIGLWLCTPEGWTFRNTGIPYLDGKRLFDRPRNDGFSDMNPGGALKPGTEHVFAMEIDKGPPKLGGTVAGAWLWFWPKPAALVDLAGAWDLSADGLTFDAKVNLPGVCNGRAFRWTGTVPREQSGRRAVIDVSAPPDLSVIVNGHLLEPHGSNHVFVRRFQLDVTPWIRFGEMNQIVMMNERNPSVDIEKIDLSFFDIGTYP